MYLSWKNKRLYYYYYYYYIIINSVQFSQTVIMSRHFAGKALETDNTQTMR